MNFEHPVLSALLPVVLLILVGFVAGYTKLVRQEAVRDLSNLVFLVLIQALLFRTMSSVHLEKLDLQPVFQYFLLGSVLFFAMLMLYGRDSRASVLSLASIFSNTLMIGVPLVGLALAMPRCCNLATPQPSPCAFLPRATKVACNGQSPPCVRPWKKLRPAHESYAWKPLAIVFPMNYSWAG